MSGLYKVCMACKNSDSVPTNGTCGFQECGGGNCFKDFEPREKQTSKTLLDEFAMAAPYRVFEEGHHGMASFASSAYCYAAAMMREKMRRDETGSAKEATEQ